jgi:plastocyanin
MDRREALRAAGVALGAGLAGCTAVTDPGGPPPDDPGPAAEEPSPTPSPAGPTVTFQGILGEGHVEPIGLHVPPGATVTFRNVDGLQIEAPHSAYAYHPDNGTELRIPAAAAPWSSPLLAPGDTWEHTFTVEGTYDYYCETHRSHGEIGRLVVGAPGGPADGSSPDHGTLPSGRRIVEAGAVYSEEMER